MRANDFYYWKFEDTLSDHDMEYILSLAKNQWIEGDIFESDKEGTRKSDIVWTTDQLVYNLIWPFMVEANDNLTHFDIDRAESLQITRYKEDEYYGYHIDGTGISYYDMPDKEFYHNKTRKLSMSLILNDDFEGGNLQFFDEEPIENKKGKMIFFPSYLTHQVTPVTKGVRYSLVAWFLGPPLR